MYSCFHVFASYRSGYLPGCRILPDCLVGYRVWLVSNQCLVVRIQIICRKEGCCWFVVCLVGWSVVLAADDGDVEPVFTNSKIGNQCYYSESLVPERLALPMPGRSCPLGILTSYPIGISFMPYWHSFHALLASMPYWHSCPIGILRLFR